MSIGLSFGCGSNSFIAHFMETPKAFLYIYKHINIYIYINKYTYKYIAEKLPATFFSSCTGCTVCLLAVLIVYNAT